MKLHITISLTLQPTEAVELIMKYGILYNISFWKDSAKCCTKSLHQELCPELCPTPRQSTISLAQIWHPISSIPAFSLSFGMQSCHLPSLAIIPMTSCNIHATNRCVSTLKPFILHTSAWMWHPISSIPLFSPSGGASQVISFFMHC